MAEAEVTDVDNSISVPRRNGLPPHQLLNDLAELLDLPEDCYGIDLYVRIDEESELIVHRRLSATPPRD